MTEDQVKHYWLTGYIVIPRAFPSDAIAALERECERLAALHQFLNTNNLRCLFRLGTDGTYELDRLDPVVDVSPAFASVARDHRLIGPVEDLLRDEVHLFKDKLILKPPGHEGYELHQDYSWWQSFPADELCTALLAVDGCDQENGGLTFFPGSHQRLLTTPGEKRGLNDEEVRLVSCEEARLIDLEPGDVVVFHSLTLHFSAPNSSSRMRRIIYLTFNAARCGNLYSIQRQLFLGELLRGMDDCHRAAAFFA